MEEYLLSEARKAIAYTREHPNEQIGGHGMTQVSFRSPYQEWVISNWQGGGSCITNDALFATDILAERWMDCWRGQEEAV